MKNAVVNDLRKEIINITNNEIKLSNNSRTSWKIQQPYLLKRELKYKGKIIEDLLAAIKLNNTAEESGVKTNQSPTLIIDTRNKPDDIATPARSKEATSFFYKKNFYKK